MDQQGTTDTYTTEGYTSSASPVQATMSPKQFHLKVDLKLQKLNSRILMQIDKRKRELKMAVHEAMSMTDQDQNNPKDEQSKQLKKKAIKDEIQKKLDSFSIEIKSKVKQTVDNRFIRGYPIHLMQQRESQQANKNSHTGALNLIKFTAPLKLQENQNDQAILTKKCISEDQISLNSQNKEMLSEKLLPQIKDVKLEDLHKYLEQVFEYINIARNQQCIIALGNQGSGKSTMLNSLIHGADFMKENILLKEDMFTQIDGKTQKKVSSVMDIDIDTERLSGRQAFKISHDGTKPETFLPDFLLEPNSGNIYVDLTGINNTNDALSQLINQITQKQLFNIVHSFQLIVPITINQITKGPEHELHFQLQRLQTIFQNNLDLSTESIFPIVSMCRKVSFHNNITKLRSNLKERLSERLRSEEKNMTAWKDQTVIPIRSLRTTLNKDYICFSEMAMDFYNKFSEKLKIFDPLDREIFIKKEEDDNDQSNQAIQIKELRDTLDKSQKILTNKIKITIPMNLEAYDLLQDMFNKKEQKCRQLAQKLLEEAWKFQNKDVNKQYKDYDEIKQGIEIHQFFSNNQLMIDSKEQLDKFLAFVEDWNQRINEKRRQGPLINQLQGDKEFKKIQSLFLDNLNELEKYILALDYENIASKLIQLFKELDSYNRKKVHFSQRQQEIEEIVKNNQNRLITCTKGLCDLKQMENFLKFAYHLRKQDFKNQITERIIKEYVQNEVIYELVMANSYKYNSMEFDEKNIEVRIFNSDNLVLFHNVRKKDQESSHGFTKTDWLKKRHEDCFNFSLVDGYFEIKTKGTRKNLAATQPFNQNNDKNKIDQQSPFLVEFQEKQQLFQKKDQQKNQSTSQNKKHNQQWILKPIFQQKSVPNQFEPQTIEANFHIQLNYGEIKPRLVSRQGLKLMATIDNLEDQYDGPQWSTWTLRITKSQPVRSQSIYDDIQYKSRIYPVQINNSEGIFDLDTHEHQFRDRALNMSMQTFDDDYSDLHKSVTTVYHGPETKNIQEDDSEAQKVDLDDFDEGFKFENDELEKKQKEVPYVRPYQKRQARKLTVGRDPSMLSRRRETWSSFIDSMNEIEEQESDPELTNDEIKHLNFNINNIIRVLKQFDDLNLLKGADNYDTDLCVTIGNTGCGKSTMLNALCFGTETLHQTVQKFENSSKRGKKVIDVKSENKQGQVKFEIGHTMQSKTFIPEFMDYPIDNILFADVAGMNDTNGNLIEFVNSFLLKQLFRRAKHVKFVIAVTLSQINEGRGQALMEQVQLVKDLAQSSEEYDLLIRCIQPVITMCKPNQKEQNDLENIQTSILQILTDDVEKVFKNRTLRLIEDQEIPEEQAIQILEEEKQRHMLFAEKFVDATVIFDPMDRNIVNSWDEQQNIKRDQMLQRIKSLKTFEGKQLQVPMKNKLKFLLDLQFDKEFKVCKDIFQKYAESARVHGKEFKDVFRSNQEIQSYKQKLKFFDEKNLTSDIRNKLKQFSSFVTNSEELIENMRSFSTLSKEGQEIHNMIHDTHLQMMNKEFNQLTTKLIELKKLIEESKKKTGTFDNIDEQAAFDIQINKASRHIENTITSIQLNFIDLCLFAFQLRKQDMKNEHTYNLLNGCVKDDRIVKLICANQWNENTERMEVAENRTHVISISQQSAVLFLQYPMSSNNKIDQVSFSKQDARGSKKFINQLKFILAPSGGFYIETLDGKRLATTVEVTTFQRQSISFVNPTQCPNLKIDFYTWHLNPYPLDQMMAYNSLQLRYGDPQPRLILQEATMLKPAVSMMSMSAKDGYHSEFNSCWRILPYNNY